MAMVSIGLVLDCQDPQILAALLGRSARLRVGRRSRAYVAPADPDGRRTEAAAPAVPETKTVKNRMHLDIDADDIEAEATRLEALGARRSPRPVHEHGTNWILMADPEGNEFCVCDGGAAS